MKTQNDRFGGYHTFQRNLLSCCIGAASILLGAFLSAHAEAPRHNIAAATLSVVQASTTDSNAVTVTAVNSVNDFRVRVGSNNGDVNVQVGNDPLDDAANGVLMSSVCEHTRNNNGVRSYCGVSMMDANANGMFIPMNGAMGLAAGDNPEFNINVAGAWFPYSTWLGGVANNTANAGPLTVFVGSPGLALGTHFIDNTGGKSTVDLTSLGIDSRRDGILLVTGAKNETANFALSKVNTTNGTWNLFIKDAGAAGASNFEQDPIAFVFVPKTNTAVISGRFLGDGSIDMYSGDSPQFTVSVLGTGRYELKMIGRSATNGVLIISAEGGGAINQDNMVNYQTNAANDGWVIETRDTPGSTTTNPALESPGPTEGVVSFVYIPIGTPGVTATPPGNMLTTESGGTATFNVSLDTAPTADVTVEVSSSDPSEGIVWPSTLYFTVADWNTPQQVTATGQDDTLTDGSVSYNVVLTPSSSDPIYGGLAPVNVSVLNADNEAGITVAPTAELVTTETGRTATFTVRLNTAPTAPVTVGFSSSDATQGTVSPTSVSFDSSNWNVEQTITVTGVDDFVDDGDVNFTIVSAPASSSDPIYNNYNPADVWVVNTDNDTAGINVTPIRGLTVNEGGTTASYTVVLETQPTADVIVNVVSSDTTEGTAAPSTLTFTPADWATPKTVTITGVDDLVQDGTNVYTVTNMFSSADTVYGAFAPIGVSATTLDNEAIVTLSGIETLWGIGMPAVGVDGRASIFDPFAPTYASATLTLTVSNASPGDRLNIRNTGMGPGQIAITTSTVFYGGVAIGSYQGGIGTNPLTCTFNASATPIAAEALLRSVTFQNLHNTPVAGTRTVTVAFVNGTGGVSTPVNKTIRIGLLRQSQFQEGADWGYGVYTGAVDIQLHQPNPDVAYPMGHATNTGLWINWPDAATANASHPLLRFDNIFGTNPGQVPTNAVIVGAELVLDINDSGDGTPLYRMLVPWDSETSTWNSMGDGIQPNDSEARFVADSQIGVEDGSGSTGLGSVSVSVTPDVIAWANGETNYGWGMPGWFERRDGTGFSPCEATNVADRPRLRVLWLPAGTQGLSFRQGVNGYAGAFDTRIRMSEPDTNNATLAYAYCDAIAAGATNNPDQILLCFDNIIGTGTGQIPPNAHIHVAMLDLASVSNSAMGDGGQVFALLKPWEDTTSTWNSWVDGITNDGVEAALTATAWAGTPSRAPQVQGGFHWFEVTSDVAAWTSGASTNYGWAILPWPNGGDGWGINLTESVETNQRPQLRVYYSENNTIIIGSITWTPTIVTINFAGPPNTACLVQRATSPEGPYVTVRTVATAANGFAVFTEAPQPRRSFYRIALPVVIVQ